MTLPRPDLSDPAERAAYRRELSGVARPVRYLGVALAIVAAVLAAGPRWGLHVPVAIPLFLLAIAALHLIAGFVIRTHYHRARMRG